MPALRADGGASCAAFNAADLSEPAGSRLDAGGDGGEVSDDPRQVELPLEWWSDDELAELVAEWRRELGLDEK
jgi:hypothetical protein